MGAESKGELRRSGFEATAGINRHDFGVSRRDAVPDGGVVVRALPGLSVRMTDGHAAGGKRPERAPLLVIFETAGTRWRWTVRAERSPP
ncbi:MAG: hypothetical protein ABSG43_29940 [Solirubrobacteraceae bacterium]